MIATILQLIYGFALAFLVFLAVLGIARERQREQKRLVVAAWLRAHPEDTNRILAHYALIGELIGKVHRAA